MPEKLLPSKDKTSNTVLRAARRYHAKGRTPTPARGKRPLLRNWQNRRLPTTEFRKQFANGRNVGLLNGALSNGLVDIDLDAPETIALAGAYLPETSCIFGRASKRRSHFVYVADPPPETAKFEDIDGTMLVELRSTGTQTIWPPSRHPSGERIEFDHDGEPARIDARALRDAVVRLAVCTLVARHWPRKNGSRHHIANALAGYLWRLGLNEQAVTSLVKQAARAAGDEEWKERSRAARETVRTLARGEPATGGPTLAVLLGEAVVRKLADWLPARNSGDSEDSAHQEPEPWAPPVPLDVVGLPAFPVNALPEPVCWWVTEVASTGKVPADLPGLLSLGVLGAAAAGRFRVRIGKTHGEPLNLYVAAVAPSGERKGPALRAMIFPIEDLERELQQAAAPEIKVAHEHRQIAEARLKHLREVAAKTEEPEKRERLEEEAKELAASLPPVPPQPRLLVSNTTPERLEELLSEQGGTICMVSEEAGSTFEIAAGRYARDGGSQLDTLLLAYDGGRINTHRIGRAGAQVDHPALSIVLTPQPRILESFSQHPEFQQRGLVARFAFAIVPSLVGTRLYENRMASPLTRMAYADEIRRILTFPKPADPDEIPALRLEGKGLEVWRSHHDQIELAQRDGERFAGMREWASKHPSRVARIAGLLHLVTCQDRQPWKIPISAQMVEAAWRIGWYLVEHALAAHDLMGADERLGDARYVLTWILNQRVESLTKRDVFQGTRGRVTTVKQLEPVLTLLVEYGYLRQRPTPPTQGAGRRSSPTYDLNPYAQNPQNPHNSSAS